MPEFPAITHVALTVTSLERSVPWYKALFGSDPILDEDTGPFQRVAWLTSGTLVGLTQFPDLNSTQPFNERRPGLDHLAFGCANRDELEAWEIRLNELGIPNGGIVDTPSYSALSFRDPDNIALEFFAPRGRTGGIRLLSDAARPSPTTGSVGHLYDARDRWKKSTSPHARVTLGYLI